MIVKARKAKEKQRAAISFASMFSFFHATRKYAAAGAPVEQLKLGIDAAKPSDCFPKGYIAGWRKRGANVIFRSPITGRRMIQRVGKPAVHA